MDRLDRLVRHGLNLQRKLPSISSRNKTPLRWRCVEVAGSAAAEGGRRSRASADEMAVARRGRDDDPPLCGRGPDSFIDWRSPRPIQYQGGVEERHQPHAHGRDARRRSRLGRIRYQPVSRADFITKIIECGTSELVKHFRIRLLRIRIR